MCTDGAGDAGVSRPQYVQNCKKIGQKSALLQEKWSHLFLFLVKVVGKMVKMPLPPMTSASTHV